MKAYVLLSNGFELMEATAPIDVLRRVGVEVETVAVESDYSVCSSNGVCVQADALLEDADFSNGDALILPGGYPGYVHLNENEDVANLAAAYYEQGKLVAAICAAPIVLQTWSIATGSKVTCHSCVREEMTDFNVQASPVVCDGNLITGIGAGHSLDFALCIAEALVGSAKVEEAKVGLEL